MKETTEPIGVKIGKFTINPDLDKYEPTPYFQQKDEDAFAFLEQHPPPAEWMKRITDRRIKHDFDNNMPIDAIAESYKLSNEDVLLRLEEMGLVAPVAA
jgi:hypothetical protein